jgi:uncharacterized membrane protein (DUF106 family)
VTDGDSQRLTSLLEEIRDNQRLQIERQAEALALQREQFELVKRQAERTERIQDRAEAIQDKSAGLVAASRRALAVILPVVVALIAWLSWLLLRR